MKRPKIVLIDGMSTAGKSTTSYNLAKKLPGWIFIDIWRFKDIFEPLGYSKNLKETEAKEYREISKRAVVNMAKEIINNTQRNIILQESTMKFVKENLGKDLKKHNYQIYNVQLITPLKQAIKRDFKRGKPTLGIGGRWNEEKWEDKVKRKTKGADVIVDTSKNSPKKVVEIILKAIKEKPKKHLHASKIRRFW